MTEPKDVPTVFVGKCPEHGPVGGEMVNFEFPTASECEACGSELPNVQEVEKRNAEEDERVTMEVED